MAGGLIQLMSYGYADKVLISDPQITFFKVVYYKHSLFTIQDHELNSETDITFGNSTFFKIRNNGDLFFSPMLKIELPTVKINYEKTLDEYLTEYNKNKIIKNNEINHNLSKLNAVLYNHDPIKFPIYINNNLILNTYYDAINCLVKDNNFSPNYDLSYNNLNLFQNFISTNNFQLNLNNLVLLGDISINSNIYYSTFNANYLTTILNSNNYLNDSINTYDDFFYNFKTNLFNYITTNDDEFKLLYSIIKNSDIINSNFNTKNITTQITTQIDYKLDYYYTNMNILYIYENNNLTGAKKLKSISYVVDYIYSDTIYTNIIIPFINLYDDFETNAKTKKYYISSGYSLNKKFNITPINNIDISNNSYDISFNTEILDLSDNIIYFIYPDITPIDQDISGENIDSANYEDFFDLYYKNSFTYKSNINNKDNLLLPICLVKYNSTTSLFDKIELFKSVTENDYVFIYNDIFIFNENSQKNEYILINDYMCKILDNSNNTYQYSDSIYLDNSKNNILNQMININNKKSYQLYSTTSSLSFIDANNFNNKFRTFEFIAPYKILYEIKSTHFYNNRMKKINNIKNTILNLDIYNNYIYNKKYIENLNISVNIKNSLILKNLSETLSDNALYIKNIVNHFLNNSIYFKQWNSFQLNDITNGNITLTISPNFISNYYAKIFTNSKINGTNYYYNNIQNIIKTNMDTFFDNYETLFNTVIRYIYNLKYVQKATEEKFTENTKLIHLLSNSVNIKSYIRIKQASSEVTYYSVDETTKINKSKIYFSVESSLINPLLIIIDKFGCDINMDNNYYCINNIIYEEILDISDNKIINLLPYDIVSAKQFYLFMYLLNYPKQNGISIIKEFYLVPYDTATFSPNLVTDPTLLQQTYSTFDIITETEPTVTDPTEPTVTDPTDPTDPTVTDPTVTDPTDPTDPTQKYKFDISKQTISCFFDALTSSSLPISSDNVILESNDLLHSQEIYFNSAPSELNPTSLDIANILYHYSYSLYIYIKDTIGPSDICNNIFATYNDLKTYENLWHLMQTNAKNLINGNLLEELSLDNTTINYIDCNINFSTIIDHVIINNSIIVIIDKYLKEYIRSDIIELLNNNVDYFNFFTNSFNLKFFKDIDLHINYFDINISNLSFIELFYWYLHFLNSIMSKTKGYIINDDSDMIFSCTLSKFDEIKKYFNDKTDFDYSDSYLSITSLNFTSTVHDLIKSINNKFNDVINFVVKLLDNQVILMENKVINHYSSTPIITANNNVIFDTLTLNEILYNLPIYFCNNFYKTYEHKTIVDFFNQAKIAYISQYKLMLLELKDSGSFSNNFYTSLQEYCNFSIYDYENNMNYYRKNSNYTNNNDIIQFKTQDPEFLFEDFYNYTITNNHYPDISSSQFNMYYKLTNDRMDANIEKLLKNINILDILYENLYTIINSFNSFFNYNYIYYSDYRIIYPFYFYLYKSYTFNYNSTDYKLYFGINNNTNTDTNYIIDNTNNKYNYSPISFLEIDSNKIKYNVINNKLYDLSNQEINYDYFYDKINIEHILYTYSFTNYLIIINDSIYDSSQNLLYNIVNNEIYDLSNSLYGYINGLIYTINNYKYKYSINSYKNQVLYTNYERIYPDNSGNFEINDSLTTNKFKILQNVFYDLNTSLVQFYFKLQDDFTDLQILNFQLLDTSNLTTLIYPSEIRPELSKIITDISLSSVFDSTFSNLNNSKTITYLNNEIKKKLDISLNKTLLIQLLNNCCKNSLFPSQYLNNDIFICSSFNNYLNYNSTNNSLNDITSWLKTYNNDAINEIKIFNQTDQKIYTILDLSNNQSNFTSKKFYFVPEHLSYYPINSSGEIVQPNNSKENFFYNNTSHFEYMLLLKKKIIKLNISDDLAKIKAISKSIKNKIIDTLITDITNERITDISNIFFNVENGEVTIYSDTSRLSNSSNFIINSNIVSKSEKDIIYGLAFTNYLVNYNTGKFYLSDTSSNYLITTITDKSTSSNYVWDKVLNGNYYKFNNSTNTVLINVNDEFPKSLFIFDGLLNRIDRVSFGYEIDSSDASCNLIYNFKYDLSFNILSRAISKFNNGLFTNYSQAKYYVSEDIPIKVYIYSELVNNYLSNSSDKSLWDSTDILVDDNDIYIVLENYSSNIKTSIGKEYIILYDTTSNTKSIFNIVTILNISGNYIMKIQSINQNFSISGINNYTLQLGIKYFIDIFGTDLMNDNCIFYYWETFYSSINSSLNLLDSSSDLYFKGRKFKLADYTEELYNKITLLSQNTSVENFLFEIPECIYNKKIGSSMTIYNNKDSIKSYFNNNKSFYKNLKKINDELKIQLIRPDIPTCSWIPYIGHFLIDKISLKLDDNIIEELDDQIIHIYNFLKSNTSKDIGLNKMIGNTPDLTLKQETIKKKILYVPLPFFFESHEKALPIISLLYSQIRVNLTLKNINDLLIKPQNSKITQLTKLKIKFCGSYVFLDNDERIKFAQMRHEYLIKTKKNLKYYINQNVGSLKITSILPTSEMFWFYIDNNIKNKKNISNYTGIDYKDYYYDDIFMNNYDQDDDVTNFINTLLKNKSNKINWYRKDTQQDILELKNNLSILDTNEIYSLQSYLYYRSKNENPFKSSKLTYNGHTRFTVDGEMSNLCIPATYYKDTLPAGLNVYTFSRYPKELTHSGSLNFKYATNLSFDYSLKFKDDHSANGEINVIFSELNILRIASGIGCLSW